MRRRRNGGNLTSLAINGRFLTQRQTGVQRFALEVVRAIDTALKEDAMAWPGGAVKLFTPPRVPRPDWLRQITHHAAGYATSGYGWEQISLPWLARNSVLLNLCNLAPLAKRRQLVVLHDAAVKARPQAYSRTYGTVHAALVPAICSRAAALATVSHFARADIAHRFAVDAGRLEICSEGAEHILRTPASPEVLLRNGLRRGSYVLAVGMGPANKNAPLLVEAFASAKLTGVALALTGRRSARVHGAAAEAPLAGIVHVGHVTDAELRALYENALILAHPSDYEGFGLPPLEAMACGCPVIASDQPALREVGGDAVCCVPAGNVPAFATALTRLATDDGLRAHLSDLGRARAALFRWSTVAQRLLAQCRALAHASPDAQA